jgi:hypothetical protein
MSKKYEYVMITTALGQVHTVEPKSPDTDTALEAGKKGGLIAAVNKMAEYDYRLLEGTAFSTEAHYGGSFVTLFMYREV